MNPTQRKPSPQLNSRREFTTKSTKKEFFLVFFFVLFVVIHPLQESSAQESALDVDEAAVQNHVEQLKTILLRSQQPDGSWQHDRYPGGLTALVVFALKHAGVPSDHPVIVNGAEYILRNTDHKVYSESLVICALELIDPKVYKHRIAEAVGFLRRAQNGDGAWSYGQDPRRGDNSNTQFAVLGLAAAERSGVEVPTRVKNRAINHWLRSQTNDGGWDYSGGNSSRLSMTCAGIASLHLLGRKHEKALDGCGEYKHDSRIESGLRSMLRQVGRGMGSSQPSYTLYALERVGMFLDLKEFDTLDWYRWGAAQILRYGRRNRISDQAFDLLFLAKGEGQIAVAKWQWSGDWNNDHHDAKSWVAQASSDFDMKLDWIPARLDEADSPASKASLIFVSGHQRFEGTASEAAFLRKFLSNRGTLVAEGCCDSQVFVEGFKDFVRTKLYPEIEVSFGRVGAAHPVCEQKYVLAPEEIAALEVKTGCHKRKILILTRDISCALNGEPCTDVERVRSQQVSSNLLEWAMRSKTPQGKLAEVELADGNDDVDGPETLILQSQPAGVSRKYHQPFGRLVHRGEWDVDLQFFPTLRRALKDHDAVPQCDGEVFVNPSSDDLFACAVLYVTGHGDPALRKQEWLPLRSYLQNGGTIVASACCGYEEFDDGFRALLRQVLPNDELETISADDAVWRAPYSRGEIKVECTKSYREEHGTKLAPLYGIRRAGRWIVLYSPADLCCDLAGDIEEGTVAYKKETALPIWVNLLNYVFTP